VDVRGPDAELILKCRSGEAGAWDALVDRYAGYVFAIAGRGYRLSAADSEDVFQEVFARLYEHLDELRDPTALRSWIGQTSRRLAIDRIRAERRERPVTGDGEIADKLESPDSLADVDLALDVRAALDSLSARCREVLIRFFIKDESYRTIADALAIPPGTIASRISRCLGTLREILAAEEAA
jgi:RNA polymerase sigma factor (sigma-70 family)